jgi:hypothetical protein
MPVIQAAAAVSRFIYAAGCEARIKFSEVQISRSRDSRTNRQRNIERSAEDQLTRVLPGAHFSPNEYLLILLMAYLLRKGVCCFKASRTAGTQQAE